MRAAEKQRLPSATEDWEVCSVVTASRLALLNIFKEGAEVGVPLRNKRRGEFWKKAFDKNQQSIFLFIFFSPLTVRVGLISPDTFAPYWTTIDRSDTPAHLRKKKQKKKHTTFSWPLYWPLPHSHTTARNWLKTWTSAMPPTRYQIRLVGAH